MSAKSIRCSTITNKGKKCRRTAQKGCAHCFQHKPSCIVHTQPACSFTPVVFNLNPVSDENCKYKNKFGEFACSEDRKHSHFCDEHRKIVIKFYVKINKLMNLLNETKRTPHALDTFMNIFYHMFNLMHKHREFFVNYSSKPAVENLQNHMINHLITFRNDLIQGRISNNLRIYRKSLPVEYHINKLTTLQTKANDLIIMVQINKARESLIANNLKIHKLSEIHLKNNKNELNAVISKGTDKKILSLFEVKKR